jgi:cold shock CspA family protein
MRFTGKLHAWNEERGFGFIRPLDGGQDVFVHVSALPKIRPSPEDILTFEVAVGPDGKKKAADVRSQHVEAAALAADRARGSGTGRRDRETRGRRPVGRSSGSVLSAVITLVLFCGVGWYGYTRYEQAATLSARERGEEPVPARCDGRTMCSQMKSCEEAKYFLRNCPGTQMDGNGDGVPCEQQWCTGGW